uniref:NADP-dependent oxidoreductase domain-containing protein n=1 Tax=Kalanchoe fedtschenkoi TaxID=63787 RepID=A0A7N0UIL4_KALFE
MSHVEAVMIPEVALTGSVRMPVIGMGTASGKPPTDPAIVRAAILEAIKTGYRHFDTAFGYGSEVPLGEAIAEALAAGLITSRRELFVTSKLWAASAQPHLVLPAIRTSLKNLKQDYMDLYLIHFPLRLDPEVRSMPPAKEQVHPLDIKSIWEAMEACQNMGLTKAIGVSNFSCKKLSELLSSAKIPPAVNQVEMSPAWHQKQLRQFCKANGIHITAYSPLGAPGTKWGDNRVVESDVLQQIAKARGKTVPQICMRWLYEQGVSVVPKSFNKERMRNNIDIFDWSLTEEELHKIDQLPQRKGVLFVNNLGPTDFALELDAEI